MAIVQVVGLKRAAVGQIDQRQVGVRSNRQPALLRQPKALRDERGCSSGDGFERQTALEIAIGQQQLQGGLAARDAAPHLEVVKSSEF